MQQTRRISVVAYNLQHRHDNPPVTVGRSATTKDLEVTTKVNNVEIVNQAIGEVPMQWRKYKVLLFLRGAEWWNGLASLFGSHF
jgi:hypothetical protein